MSDDDWGAELPERSILSYGERQVARHLREHPDATPADIAEARGVDPEAVEKSIERIREKTVRAVATLAESPFLEEVAADMDDELRDRIVEGLRDED